MTVYQVEATVARWSCAIVATGLSAVLLAGCSSPPASVSTAATTASTGTQSASPAATTPSPSTSAEAAPTGPHWTYAAFGDSNFYALAQDCGGCTSFPKQLARAITRTTGVPVALLEATQHNFLTAPKLLQEITEDDWLDAPDGPVRVTDRGPRATIAAADLITLSVGQNDLPWQNDSHLCGTVYDAACRAKTIPPYIKALDGVLTQITALRAGKPTAVRVTTLYNDRIDDVGKWEDPVTVAQARTTLRTYLDDVNKEICTVAAKHQAVCVDTYHLVNGRNGTAAMTPGYFFSSVPGSGITGDCCGDLNERGQKEFAAAVLKSGFAPLRRPN